jgi:ribosomal protein S18 acetylase RimI-like enzyme
MSTILKDFSPATLVNAIERNAIEGVKAWANWPEMEYREDYDMVSTLTNIPSALFNNVLKAQLKSDNIEERIDTVLERARMRNIPMSWWIGPSTTPSKLGLYLEAQGWTLADSNSGMATDLHALIDNLPKPDGLRIDEVANVETLRAWGHVTTSVYEFPELAKEPWFDIHLSMGLGTEQPWRHYIAWLDGQPVAAASLFLGAGVAGIANVATLPEARRQGIGGTITLEPLREARRMGYRVGILFASEMGKGLYRKLGFREYCKGTEYVWADDRRTKNHSGRT